jgi:ribosomal protein S19
MSQALSIFLILLNTATDLIRQRENSHVEVELSTNVMKHRPDAVQIARKQVSGTHIIQSKAKSSKTKKNSDAMAIFSELIAQAVKVYDGDSKQLVRDIVRVQQQRLIKNFEKKAADLVPTKSKPSGLQRKKN